MKTNARYSIIIKNTIAALSLVAILAAVLATVTQAYANAYDITFTGEGITASGQIDVSAGLATGGYLDVTAGPIQGTYNLAPGGGPVEIIYHTGDGIDLYYYNLVNVVSNPFLDYAGLAFVNGPWGFNLWSSGGGIYSLLGDAPQVNYPQPNVEVVRGSATIAPVPEPSTLIPDAVLLLPFGLGAVRQLRKNL